MSFIIGLLVFFIVAWGVIVMIESGVIYIVLGGVVVFAIWVAANQHNTPVDTVAQCKQSLNYAYSTVPHTTATYAVYVQHFHDCEQSNSQ